VLNLFFKPDSVTWLILIENADLTEIRRGYSCFAINEHNFSWEL
jgi:hypothetical protein